METTIILGGGSYDGLGAALARRFAAEGHHILYTGRTPAKLEETADRIRATGASVETMAVDVTNAADQNALFTRAAEAGPLAAVLFNAGNNAVIPFEQLTEDAFENFWRVCCFGAFLTAKRALPLLKAQGKGSLFYTGASASLRGKPNFGHFSSAKGALRNLVQALAREYGPLGVHVAHVIIDGVINGDRVREHYPSYLEQLGEDGSLDPDAIAETFWATHAQPRCAWSQEVELRPFKENW